MVDGAQAVMHMSVDVQDLDCDFYAFTGHKIYGPSGIGVLYGKAELLDAMPPFLGGGDMISTVTMEKSTWAALPAKFEAETPPIVQAVGLGAALEYVSDVGLEAIAAHENDLLNYATQQLASVKGLKIVGTAPSKTSVISFTWIARIRTISARSSTRLELRCVLDTIVPNRSWSVWAFPRRHVLPSGCTTRMKKPIPWWRRWNPFGSCLADA